LGFYKFERFILLKIATGGVFWIKAVFNVSLIITISFISAKIK